MLDFEAPGPAQRGSNEVIQKTLNNANTIEVRMSRCFEHRCFRKAFVWLYLPKKVEREYLPLHNVVEPAVNIIDLFEEVALFKM